MLFHEALQHSDHALGPGSHPRAAHGEIFPDVPGQLRDAGRILVAAEDRRHHGHRVLFLFWPLWPSIKELVRDVKEKLNNRSQAKT